MFLRNPDLTMDPDEAALREFAVAKNLVLSADEFILGGEIARGGYGVVFNATRRSDAKVFAIKFFGYTDKRPGIFYDDLLFL